MEIRFIIAAICLGIGCFIAGFLTDAILQTDYIKQKDDEIRQLKGEKKAMQDQLYKRPDLAYDGNRYSKPNVEVIDLPKADRTYHQKW